MTVTVNLREMNSVATTSFFRRIDSDVYENTFIQRRLFRFNVYSIEKKN